MSRAHRSMPLLLAASVALVPSFSSIGGFAGPADKDRGDPIRTFAKLERGMTPEQVRQLAGAPKHIARQILYHRYREQWIYDAPVPVRLTFDCPRGQKPQLLSPPGVPDQTEPRP